MNHHNDAGLYHLIFLPALLIEMEVGACTGEGSLLGTLDQATLVATSMAVMSANWLRGRCTSIPLRSSSSSSSSPTSFPATPSYDAMLASAAAVPPMPASVTREGNARAARAAGRAAWTNWWFGDFIEAAYPVFDRDHATYAAALVGAAAAGAVTVGCNVKSSAYLPIPLSIVLANKPAAAAAVYALQFIPPFVVELLKGS